MQKTFSQGVHLKGNKELSSDISISVMVAPQVIYVPMMQSAGNAPERLVKEGQTVACGELIAKKTDGISANVFSPVSGTVKAIVNRPDALGRLSAHIEIVRDSKSIEKNLPVLKDASQQQIIQRVEDAGIVGMGGAAFPTAIKLTVPDGKTIDTVIVNACECEPYLTCDYRILKEYSQEILRGVKLVQRATQAKRVVIATEYSKQDALESMRALNGDVEFVILKDKYPQGAEKQLIYAVTKRKVPIKQLPSEVGVLVINVHTVLAIVQAVELGKPSYERVVTVSGGGIKQRKNVWVSTGTTIADLVEYCGGLQDNVKKVIVGGPMTGYSQSNLNASITKATSSVLFLTEQETESDMAMACIGCRRCAEHCPMQLMPMYIDGNTILGNYAGAKRFGAVECIECGCCSFVCPAKRPLLQSIRLGKKLIKERNI